LSEPRLDVLRVYLVVNGPLGMSEGKIAAQAFQACQRLMVAARVASSELPLLVERWEEHTTTIARVAKTPRMFERVKAEVPGVVMVDEGYTEVAPGSETVFASWPLLIGELPKILKNEKVPLL